jgi:alpha-tubulin suppressor-like RCC1 family protein/chitodextrinase
MGHRLMVRALAGAAASTLGFASLVVVGLATAPAANAATTPGTPWTFGENAFGQLGSGNTTTRRSAGPVVGLDGVIDLHGGREHVVALKSDGGVWTWGSNVEGQQAKGTTANGLVPSRVTSLGFDNVAVETGHNHTVVLKGNGTVWAAGLNSDGQLGDGTTTLRRSPVQVAGITDAVAIAAGRDMTYAIRSNGTLWGWGRNDEGQLGDGSLTRRLAPVRVGTLTNVKAVAGGRDHGLAVLTDGSLWAWGSNDYGQVGDNSITDRTAPVRIIASGIADVAAGAHHSYALRTDGTVASWGRNYRAELGDGTGTSRRTPVSVVGVSGATTIGSGRDMGIVTLGDGRVKAWGHNLYGQLGDGTTTDRTSAVFVPGVTNAVKSAGGGATYGVVLVGDTTTPPANVAPVARITGSCTDLSCPLSGSTSTDSDGTITDYLWNFGDGATATGVAPGHTYAEADTYTVSLTVTDDDGATHVTTRSVTVTDPVTPPDNVAPVAHITGSCTNLTCPLSGGTSTDGDGTITDYLWDFGDGATANGVAPGHTYGTPGTYTVTLTVTDDDTATGTDTRQVMVTNPPVTTVAFRAAAATDANTTSAAVVVPGSVQPGDQLVLVATTNTAATATTPAGWTLLSSAVDGTELKSSVWTRTAVAGTAGSTVRVVLSAISKTSLSVLAYSGAAPVTTLASAVQGTAIVAAHPAPAASVATAGSTVLRHWADKASTVHGWTLPANVTQRAATTGTGGGLVATATGETAGVPAGTVAASTATSGLASAKALAWTIVVPPA